MPIKCLPISKLEPGMILAKPALDDKGRTLCKDGTPLSESLISRFEKLGVGNIHVFAQDPMTEAEYTYQLEQIEHRFKRIPESSFLQEFKRIAMKIIEDKYHHE